MPYEDWLSMVAVRRICTAERPFRFGYEAPNLWAHPEAAELSGTRSYTTGGETRLLRCPICGSEIEEFIPFGSPIFSDTIRYR
jgi:hypothetical protein